MKPIKEYLSLPPADNNNQSQPSGTISFLKEDTIRALFKYLSASFGASWNNQITPHNKPYIMDVWDKTLKNFSHEDCINAKNMLQSNTTRHVRYPPTALEFSELCKLAKERRTKDFYQSSQLEDRRSNQPPYELNLESMKKYWDSLSLEERKACTPPSQHEWVERDFNRSKPTDIEKTKYLDDKQRADDMRKTLK